jgi:hypothetical protein
MKKGPFLSSLLLGGLALTLTASSALAQTETAPPPAAPPPVVVSSGYSNGGAGIGIGAVDTLGGLAGGQFVYDQAMFHLEGILGYQHISRALGMPSSTNFGFGVGGWYHLFRGINSDFSLGGVAGIIYASTGPGSSTGFTLEPGAEARVFLTPNFALEGRVGFAITFGDNNADTVISLGGQTNATFGFTYFIR